jgi:holo-[acyl-carrier protein] synthase
VSVIGIGVDAVEIARLRAALERTPTLLGRLFTPAERAVCRTRAGDLQVGRLAARFAAKEAVAKAFGTGVRGFAFQDIEILGDELGRPHVQLRHGAAAVAASLGVARVHLSMTTCVQLAIANAVLES